MRTVIETANENEFWAAAKKVLRDVDVLLDVGCGIRPTALVKSRLHVCVEPWVEYVAYLLGRKEADLVVLNRSIQEASAIFPDSSVDSVFAMDVIEHLTKGDGTTLLREAQRMAARQVVIFTPLGYFENDLEDGERDRWGMMGGALQHHQSGWTLDDFDGDWTFVLCRNFHKAFFGQKKQEDGFGAFLAVKDMEKPRAIEVSALESMLAGHRVQEDEVLPLLVRTFHLMQEKNLRQFQEIEEMREKLERLERRTLIPAARRVLRGVRSRLRKERG
jgi:hypothetical protein